MFIPLDLIKEKNINKICHSNITVISVNILAELI